MARDKLAKFADITSWDNVLEFPEDMKGKWAEIHFGNSNPIVLELACGKGAYTLGLARMFAEKNFVGVDRKGERIWRGAKTAIDDGLGNVAFLRIFIEKLDDFFAEGEVDEIWITFPDPFPKDRHEKRRLTAPHLLDMYRRVLKPGGVVHLKTDADSLYEYSLETMAKAGVIVEQCDDVYAQEEVDPILEIKTPFEERHLADGRTIRYISVKM